MASHKNETYQCKPIIEFGVLVCRKKELQLHIPDRPCKAHTRFFPEPQQKFAAACEKWKEISKIWISDPPPPVKMDHKIQYSLATSRGPRDGHHMSA